MQDFEFSFDVLSDCNGNLQWDDEEIAQDISGYLDHDHDGRLDYCQFLAGYCFADFNMDGGIEGGDIELFFLVFELRLWPADVNFDGAVAGSDVEAFFVAWQAGTCDP